MVSRGGSTQCIIVITTIITWIFYMVLAGAIRISLGNLSRLLMSGNHIRDCIMKFKTHILVFQCCWKFWWCRVEFGMYAGLNSLWAKQKIFSIPKRDFYHVLLYGVISGLSSSNRKMGTQHNDGFMRSIAIQILTEITKDFCFKI